MPTFDELLKKSTALKREKDLNGAITLIHQALNSARSGDASRPQAQTKLIYYLLSAKRYKEALDAASQMIDEAPAESLGDKQLIGAFYSKGFRERAKVLLKMKENKEAFLDLVRACWHWQSAMKLQGRDKREHTPTRAAAGLVEAAHDCGLAFDENEIKSMTLVGLNDPDPDSMAIRFSGFKEQEL